jgi:hypothetical protein
MACAILVSFLPLCRVRHRDPDRSRAEYAAAALEDLPRLGLDWQKGPEVGVPFGPYAQSERGDVYRAGMQRLPKRGDALSLRALRERGRTAAEILREQAFPSTHKAQEPFPEGEEKGDSPQGEGCSFVLQHVCYQCHFVSDRQTGEYLANQFPARNAAARTRAFLLPL